MLHQLYFTYVAIRLLVISILSTSLRDLFLLRKTVTAPRILTYSLKINSKIHFYTFRTKSQFIPRRERSIYQTFHRSYELPIFIVCHVTTETSVDNRTGIHVQRFRTSKHLESRFTRCNPLHRQAIRSEITIRSLGHVDPRR